MHTRCSTQASWTHCACHETSLEQSGTLRKGHSPDSNAMSLTFSLSIKAISVANCVLWGNPPHFWDTFCLPLLIVCFEIEVSNQKFWLSLVRLWGPIWASCSLFHNWEVSSLLACPLWCLPPVSIPPPQSLSFRYRRCLYSEALYSRAGWLLKKSSGHLSLLCSLSFSSTAVRPFRRFGWWSRSSRNYIWGMWLRRSAISVLIQAFRRVVGVSSREYSCAEMNDKSVSIMIPHWPGKTANSSRACMWEQGCNAMGSRQVSRIQ